MIIYEAPNIVFIEMCQLTVPFSPKARHFLIHFWLKVDVKNVLTSDEIETPGGLFSI